MRDALDFARDALDRAETAWDDARVDAMLVRTHAGVERRRRVMVGLAVAAIVVVTTGVGAYLAGGAFTADRQGSELRAAAEDLAPVASAAGWSLEIGGSRVAVLGEGTDVRALPNQPDSAGGERAGFELVSGAARVDATALYVIVAGQRLVADRAAFELVLEGAGFTLRVDEGVVRFGEREIGAGMQLVFEPGAAAVPAAPQRDPDAIETDTTLPVPVERTPTTKPAKAPKPKWRALVQSREWAEAYTEMKRADPKTLRSSVDALMAAADAARFGGHPDEAPTYLDEVIDDHARHGMAPLAAFTLGRVYLEQLGAPGKAARAFANARSLAPSGAIAADALAREVEAWAKAGDADKARERAREYVAAYPDGKRIAAVRRHGGLGEP